MVLVGEYFKFYNWGHATEDREGDYSLSREIFVESFTTVDTIREEYSR